MATTVSLGDVPIEPQIITLTVNYTGTGSGTDSSGYDIVPNQRFVCMPEKSIGQLVWQIEAGTSVPPGVQLRFDSPGITFFGQTVNMLLYPDEVQPFTERVALWRNDVPGRSFPYRIHILAVTGDGTPDVHYTPITHDPIVHNDPPPAPEG